MKCTQGYRPKLRDITDQEAWLATAVSRGLVDFTDHNGEQEFFLTAKGRDAVAQFFPPNREDT